MPPSFWVLKIPFIKKNLEQSQNERLKKRQQMEFVKKISEVDALFWTFGISSIVRSEAVVWRCSVKKVFLEISQNS